METWPEVIPAPLIGSTFKPVDPQIRTELQNGRQMVRQNFTSVPENFDVTWRMNDEQATVFEHFYWSEIKAGTEWFLMNLNLPQGRGLRPVRFNGAFTREQLTPGRDCVEWEYTAQLQHYLRYSEEQ